MVISDLLDTIRLLFVSEKKPFLRLKSILGFYPHNIKLYRLALMHKSVTYHEKDKSKEDQVSRRRARHKTDNQHNAASQHSSTSTPYFNNERLEFLGDAVLGAIVADILYKHYGRKQEGFLTSLRSKIVCRKSLNQLAVNIGLDQLIRHAGAITTGHNSFMSGNAFEAFFGAIYLDRGYGHCYRFMENVVFKKYIDIEEVAKVEENFKSKLIEWCQKHQYTFTFRQKESRDTQDHNAPVFHSSVLIEGIPCGTGDGYTKKESDQKAAQQALKRIKSDKELRNGIQAASEKKKSSDITD